MSSGSFLTDIFQAIADRGRSLVFRRTDARIGAIALSDLFEMLIAGRGEASGLALAAELLSRWESGSSDDRLAFLNALAELGPDTERLDAAIERYRADPSAAAAVALHHAAEPRRQEVIRRMNMAPSAMHTLVGMREELLRQRKAHPELAPLEADFVHLLSSWFNRGFLVLRRIDWSTPANILEKIIRYEAVHEIGSWDDLRRRIEPGDRRCFAFFHPRLVDEPLIFVEVALMRDTPSAIADVLAEDRRKVAPEEATAAVFYSISNCQEGLRGISFGNFLLKQVIEDLRQEMPGITQFVTLSPAPRFAAWLGHIDPLPVPALEARRQEALRTVANPDWPDDPQSEQAMGTALPSLAAYYLAHARNRSGLPVDPVARFHLGNGARLERINFLGDRSPRALGEAHGLMVNYLYRLDDLERNHELFASKGEVVTSRAVRRLVADNGMQRAGATGPAPAQSLPEESAA